MPKYETGKRRACHAVQVAAAYKSLRLLVGVGNDILDGQWVHPDKYGGGYRDLLIRRHDPRTFLRCKYERRAFDNDGPKNMALFQIGEGEH